MPFLDPKPNPFRRGDPAPGATDLNKIVQAVLRQIRGGGNTNVSDFGDRVVVHSDQTQTFPVPANYITQFVVLEEFDDMLKCVPFQQPISSGLPNTWIPQPYYQALELESQSIFYVAKPYTLQVTPWDRKFVTINGETVLYRYINSHSRLVDSLVGDLLFLQNTPILNAGGGLPADTSLLYVIVAERPNGTQWAISDIRAVRTDATRKEVHLSWLAASGSTSYSIYRSNGSSTYANFKFILNVTTLSAFDSGLADGSRSVGSDPAEITQDITPQYMQGDVVAAIRTWTGCTDPGGNVVIWMDCNTAGRQWLTPPLVIAPDPCNGTTPPILYAEVNLALLGSSGVQNVLLFASKEYNGFTTWTGGGPIYDDTVAGAGALLGTLWLRFVPLTNTYLLQLWVNGTLSEWEPESFACSPFLWSKGSIATIVGIPPGYWDVDPDYVFIQALIAAAIPGIEVDLQAYVDSIVPGAVNAQLAAIGGQTTTFQFVNQFSTISTAHFTLGLLTAVT